MLIHNPLAFQLAFQKEKNRECLLEILNKTLYTTPAQPYPQDFSFSGFHLGFIVWGGKFPPALRGWGHAPSGFDYVMRCNW